MKKTHTGLNGQASFQSLLLLAVCVSVFFVFGMLYGDTARYQFARMLSLLRGEVYSGHGPSRITQARTKGRSLRNFDDARVREDQYNRQDEPKKSRK